MMGRRILLLCVAVTAAIAAAAQGYRDLNRGDQRMLWNTIINWQAILASQPSPAAR